jgi:GNAT superfamily N-acetyltransferase
MSNRPRSRLPQRAAHADDLGALRAFLQRLSPGTLRARYLSPLDRLPEPCAGRELDRLLDRHGGKHAVVLAVDGAAVRGIGEYLQERTGGAELALLVEDDFQGRSVGRALLCTLQQLAREHGIGACAGDVSCANRRALLLLWGTRRGVHTDVGDGSPRIRLPLRE